MNINDLLNHAFIEKDGSVEKMYSKYYDTVNVMGKPIDKIAIACQYVKILFAVEHLEKEKPLSYYKEVSELRLENWIKANYKK